MLTGISVTCFLASYLVVFGLDVSRLYFRATLRNVLLICFATAGWIAHASFLGYQAGNQWESGVVISSWESWCWTVSLILASCYLFCLARYPDSIVGFFLMPLTIGVVVAGILSGNLEPFSPTVARSVWHSLHGISLLIGLVAVFLGFAAGLMYLVQSYRLKKHAAISTKWKSLSLESLQWVGERSLLFSTIFVAFGLIAGVVLNLRKLDGDIPLVSWSDPVVWTSSILFFWLVIVLGFNLGYRPARQGRKVAYLVIASFLFLVVEITIAISVGHGKTDKREGTASEGTSIDSSVDLRQYSVRGIHDHPGRSTL